MRHFTKGIFLAIFLLSFEQYASAQPVNQSVDVNAYCYNKVNEYIFCVPTCLTALDQCENRCLASFWGATQEPSDEQKQKCHSQCYGQIRDANSSCRHDCACRYASEDCLKTMSPLLIDQLKKNIEDDNKVFGPCTTIRSPTNLPENNPQGHSPRKLFGGIWGKSVSLLDSSSHPSSTFRRTGAATRIAAPLATGAGVEAKIFTPPNPSSIADLVAEQTEQSAQQKCVDDYLQCFRECSNGTEPLIKADDPDLGAACQKVRDPKNAALVCNAKIMGCFFLTCDPGHQNPLDQKAAGYLACTHENANLPIGPSENIQSSCSQQESYWGSQQVSDVLVFVNEVSERLFVKATGRQSEENGCAIMSQDTPLFHCVSACWGAPYGATRCN